MQLRRTADGIHGWFMVQDGEGRPSAIPPHDFRVAVVDPHDRQCLSPVVLRGRVPGMFVFAIPEAFLEHEGDYTVGISAPGHRVAPALRKVHVVR